MALLEGMTLVNIVRTEIVTEEDTPKSYIFTTASEASVEPNISGGEEKILRVKNQILATNKTEDIVVGYDLTFRDNTLIPELLALVDGGILLREEPISSEAATGDIDSSNKTFTTTNKPLKAGSLSIISDSGQPITDNGDGTLSDGGTVNYENGEYTLNVAPSTSVDHDYIYFSEAGTGDIGRYEGPESGKTVSRIKFTLNVFTEEKDESGDTTKYAKFTYKHCKGKPVGFSLKDGEFYVPELKAESRPKSGEKPVVIDFLDALPAIS